MKITNKMKTLYKRGFTVVEIMVAVAILSVVTLGLVQFNFVLFNNAFDSRETVEVAEKIRTFTSNLSRDGRSSRKIILYQGIPGTTADLGLDRRLADGQTGDMVVFVHVRPERIQDAAVGTAQRFLLQNIIVYARVPDANDSEGRGPVLRYEIRDGVHFNADPDNLDEISIRDDPATNIIGELLAEMLVPGHTQTLLNRPPRQSEVVELARGLADGNLFRNFRDNSIVVNGEIVAGNFRRQDGQLVVQGNRFVNNTYNFTITRQG